MTKPFGMFRTVLIAWLLLGGVGAQAEAPPPHLYEAAREDPALKAGFAALMEPVIQTSPWVGDYGTTAPPERAVIDDVEYQVYWGCKPHDCIRESYTVLYAPASRQVVAGAFVRNTFAGPAVTHSDIVWLGQVEWDQAKALGKYLY